MLRELVGFDETIQKMMKDWKVPGTAIAVIKDGEIVHSQGYGLRDVKNNLPVDENTIFAIGSSSKAFTTLSLGILVDQGKIEWDRPVREYIPTFKLFDPFATERMTPRDLVCHRSGLPRHDLMWYGTKRNRKELFDRLQFLEPNKDFRTYMQYQNLMFMTAGYLVEVITGLTWEQFVQKEIFSPLGMTRSNVSVEDLKNLDGVGLPYRKDKNLVKEIEFANIDTIGPAGSINSSIADMTQWLKLQMGDGKFGENQIVSKTNLDEMHKPNMVISNAFFGPLEKYPEFANGSYGLGWFINTYHGQKLVHHGGNIDGFSAMVAFMPDEKCGVVVLTNLNGTPVRDIAMLNLFDRFLGKKQLPWSQRMKKEYKELEDAVKKGKKQGQTKRVHNTRPSHQPEAYIGEFEHAGYGTVTISKDTDGLKSNYNGMDMKLKHYHYDVFEMTNEEIEMTLKVNFFSDVHGNITSFSTPLEPSVKDIIFTRKADSKVSDQNFLEQFVGDYELMGQNMIVSLHGSNLSIKLPGQPELELEPYQGTSFKVKNVPAILIEFKIENGHVTAVDVNQAGMLFTGKKK